MHWTTLEKILSQSSPPGYQMQQLRQKPKLGSYVDFIRQILILDKQGKEKGPRAPETCQATEDIG